MAKTMYIVRRIAIATDAEGMGTWEYAVIRVDGGEQKQVGGSYVDIAGACNAQELLAANEKITSELYETDQFSEGLKKFLIGMGVVFVAIIAGTILSQTILFVGQKAGLF
jgi:hypothetical protein